MADKSVGSGALSTHCLLFTRRLFRTRHPDALRLPEEPHTAPSREVLAPRDASLGGVPALAGPRDGRRGVGGLQGARRHDALSHSLLPG